MFRSYVRRPSKHEVKALSADLAQMVSETEGLGPPSPELLTDCGDGEIRSILTYPDPRLRVTTTPVLEFDDHLRKLVADLALTMYATNGIGIAAPQIGEAARVFLVDILNGQPAKQGHPTTQLLVAVNPQVWTIPDKVRRDAERCLSFPKDVVLVTRPAQIFLKAHDHRGKPYALGCGGDLSRAIQHEFDHLEGYLLVDRVSSKTGRSNGKRKKN